MMKYGEGEKLADTRPCAAIRADLKMCLLSSDCCKKVNVRLFFLTCLFLEYYSTRIIKGNFNRYCILYILN